MLPEKLDMSTATAVRPQVHELDQFDAAADYFLRGCEERFSRIVGYGPTLVCSSNVTHYVIPGREFCLSDGGKSLTAWIGLNGDRIFFITRYLATPDALREKFHFSLGGAEKVGWHFHFEPVHHAAQPETSIWGTVQTGDRLICPRTIPPTICGATQQLTDAGCFWVNDIAMMLQSLLRTGQRSGLKNGEHAPAPL